MHIYSNMSLDEMLREISISNYDLFVALESKINDHTKQIYSAAYMEVEAKQEETGHNVTDAVEAMQYLCTDPKWIKTENTKTISYYIESFHEDTHYENHNISITCDKDNRSSWEVRINCGQLGETGSRFTVNGNYKDAQKTALEKAKDHLLNGSYFILP